MVKLRTLIFALGLCAGALSLLSSCGVPICVAGLGDCSAYFDKQEEMPTPTATATVDPFGALTISGASTISLSSPVVTFSTSGGNGVYTYVVSPTSCGVFQAFVPGNFTAQTVATCLITVTDTSSPVRNGTFRVTVTL